jgi:hypothetical protein
MKGPQGAGLYVVDGPAMLALPEQEFFFGNFLVLKQGGEEGGLVGLEGNVFFDVSQYRPEWHSLNYSHKIR